MLHENCVFLSFVGVYTFYLGQFKINSFSSEKSLTEQFEIKKLVISVKSRDYEKNFFIIISLLIISVLHDNCVFNH